MQRKVSKKMAKPKKAVKKVTKKIAAKKSMHKAPKRSLHTSQRKASKNSQRAHSAINLTSTHALDVSDLSTDLFNNNNNSPISSLFNTQTRSSHALSTHMDTPYNNASTKFEFTPDSMKKIDVVLKKFPANYKQSAVMPVLFIAQEQNDNWLPLAAMNKVAEMLDMPPMRVYEVATFYTMYNRDKVGKFHIQVCGTTTCMTMGARDIKKAAKKFAGVHHDGEISADNNFCITEVECLGACTNAPMVQVNNHWFYENLTEATMVDVMKGLLNGTAKPGPQNGQKVAEGPQGPKTLVNYENHFPKFDMARFDAKLNEMTQAAKVVPPAAAAPAPAAAPKVEEKKAEAPKVEEKKAEAPKAPEAAKPAAPAPKVEEKKAEAAPAAEKK